MRPRAPIGWPLFPMPDAAGRLAFPSSLDESVRASLRVILSTRPGELLFHPDFGAGLDEVLHEPNTLELRREVHDRITESVTRWEPRVELTRVEVDEVPGAPTRLRVQIGYRLKRSGVPQVLGLTLDAGR